jgi:hypothetical protein
MMMMMLDIDADADADAEGDRRWCWTLRQVFFLMVTNDIKNKPYSKISVRIVIGNTNEATNKDSYDRA